MAIFRARRPIVPDWKVAQPAPSTTGDNRPAICVRPPAIPAPAGGVITPIHAPLPGEYAPPPARVVQAPVPVPRGAVVAGGSYPGELPSVPIVRPAVAREVDRPGQGGTVIRQGFAPPEEPSPRPVPGGIVRAADTMPPGSVHASGMCPPADNAPPTVSGGIVRDRGQQPGGEGWAYGRGTTGPPEPRPGVGQVLVREAEAIREPGRAVATGSYDFGLPPGLYLPAVRVVCEVYRPGFAGRVVSSSAAPDAVTPDPDPIFQWYTNAAVRLRSRRGKT